MTLTAAFVSVERNQLAKKENSGTWGGRYLRLTCRKRMLGDPVHGLDRRGSF